MSTPNDLAQNNTMTRAFTASVAVTVNRFVNITGVRTVGLPAAGGRAVGVAQNSAALGERVTMKHSGPASVEVGVGGVAAGDNVAADALGRAVKATGPDELMGVAAETGVMGDTVLVEIYAIGKDSLAGSGTLNTLAQWTPNGTTLGDSAVTQDAAAPTGSWNVDADASHRFLRGANRRLYIQSYIVNPPATTDRLEMAGQTGVPGTVVPPFPGSLGGDLLLDAGNGGDGTAVTAAGKGGTLFLYSGAAGAALAGGGNDSGDIILDVQAFTGAGVAGAIFIGTTGGGGVVPREIDLGILNGGPIVNIFGTSISVGLEDAAAGTSSDAMILVHDTTAASAAGLATGLLFDSMDDSPQRVPAARIAAEVVDPVAATFAAKTRFENWRGGVFVQRAQIDQGLAVGTAVDPGPGRIALVGTTSLTPPDVTFINAAFGVGPVVGAVTGNSSGGSVRIAAGAAPAAGAAFTLTFPDGTWTNAPFVLMKAYDANTGLPLAVLETSTALDLTGTLFLAPVAGDTIEFRWIAIGT